VEPWQQLDVAPDSDPVSIRRAYAQRLKRIDIDRNPLAFQSLRMAYERALAEAQQRRRAPPSTGVPEPERPSAATEARPSAEASSDRTMPAQPLPSGATASTDSSSMGRGIAPDAEVRRVVSKVTTALNAGDVEDALALMEDDRAIQALPLATSEELLAAMVDAAIDDRTLRAEAFRRIARRCGLDLSRPYGGNVLAVGALRLARRLDAEEWYERLLQSAAAVPPARRREVMAARLLLGRSSKALSFLYGLGPTMRHLLGQYYLHALWLQDRFDPARVAWCRRLAARSPSLFLLGGLVAMAGLWWGLDQVSSRRHPVLSFVMVTALICVLCIAAGAAVGLARFLGWRIRAALAKGRRGHA